MWTLAVIFLFSVLHSGFACFAEEPKPTSACEAEAQSGNPSRRAQNSAISVYVNSARKGIGLDAISIEDLEWAAAQERPVSPFRSERDINNLSIRDVLARATSKILKEEWPQAVAQIKDLIVELSKANMKVQAVRELTAPVLKVVPHPIFSGNSPELGFSTSVSKKDGLTSFLKWGQSEATILEKHPFSNNFKTFFEMKDGNGFYASISDLILRVSDTSSGKLLRTLKLMDIAKVSEMPLNLREHRPIFFEREGRLQMALVPTQAEDVRVGPSKMVYLVDVLSGEITERAVTHGKVWYKALGREQLYAYGADDKSQLFIFDLINEKYSLWEGPRLDSRLHSFAPDIAFDENGLPRLFFTAVNFLQKNIYVVGNGKVERVPLGGGDLKTHIDHSGKIWYTNLRPRRRDTSTLEFGVFKTEGASVDLRVRNFSHQLKDVAIVETRQGVLIFISEEHSSQGNLMGYHVVAPYSQHVTYLAIHPQFEISHVGPPFFDREKNTVFVFLKPEQGRWQQFQLFGPLNLERKL